ncbi:hypothetical protein SBOR_8218 [Sclerotinia borealis F-4128]|uniref:Uncharacterized protein n=1 Tax=Sclerotinia borealis (strain F-4128) TaxID=1432307 RepID=W9C959_SCLBF|nr:hypothetical protein SBOR_8218 [Sclerotinia borealis F-4128]
MPLFHGIYSSSAPQNIGITICNSSTNDRAFRYTVPVPSPWHHPTFPEIRPFSPNLHILIDDKQNLRYYILRPPPDKEPFNTSCLPTVSSVMPIRRCSRKAVIEEIHNSFGIQKLRDFKSGLCYSILTARFIPNAVSPITASAVSENPKTSQTIPYVIRPAAELPQIIASGDLYPLECGSHSLDVPSSELQFHKAHAAICSWYFHSFPWLSLICAQTSVRKKALKDCQILAQQCRWRNGGWLLDHHIQQFYGSHRSGIPSPNNNIAVNPYFTDNLVVTADPNDYIEGPWVTDGLYKRTRITLRRKYLMEFPWFEISSLKRKVEYDIGFLHMAYQLMSFPYMTSNRVIINEKTLQDKEIIEFYNAEIYDLVTAHPHESALVGKVGRLQARVDKHRPHINVDLAAIPQSWRKLMSFDE